MVPRLRAAHAYSRRVKRALTCTWCAAAGMSKPRLPSLQPRLHALGAAPWLGRANTNPFLNRYTSLRRRDAAMYVNWPYVATSPYAEEVQLWPPLPHVVICGTSLASKGPRARNLVHIADSGTLRRVETTIGR